MTTPRILFVGDPHGDIERVRAIALEHRPEALVLLGDVELLEPLDQAMAPVLDAGVEVCFIPGNHDDDMGPEQWGCLTSATWNPRTAKGALHGRVRDVAGVRIAGLGGVFCSRTWLPPDPPKARSYDEFEKRCQRLWPQNGRAQAAQYVDAIFPAEYEALRKHRCEILVTHEAPSSHWLGNAALDELARAMGARLVVHGHHHVDYLARHDTGLMVAGVGLAAAIDEEGNQVAETTERQHPISRWLAQDPPAGWTRLR